MTNINSHRDRGDAAGMAAGFPISIRHAFNDHLDCGSWCKSLSSDPKIKAKAFQRLPYKKPLVGVQLKKLLLEMVAEKCNIKICERLQHSFSSQNNERFNNMIASKCNKARAQTGGLTYEGRGHHCIVVKNLGHGNGISSIMKQQGLTTCGSSQYFHLKTKRARKANAKAATVEQKRKKKPAWQDPQESSEPCIGR